MEVNVSLFDINERLIRYQSEEIKLLRDEINNTNLIIETLLKNRNNQNFSYRSDFNSFDNSFKNSLKNNSLNLRKQLKRNNLKTIKVITHLLINMNRWQSKTVTLMMTSLLKHLMIITKKITLEATLVIIKSIIILYLR